MNKIAVIDTQNSGKKIFLFLIVIWALAEYLMFFNVGSGEHDTFQMISGILYGVNQDSYFNIANYNEKLQFLFYIIFHYLAQYIRMDSSGLLLLLNATSAILSLVILVLLMRVFNLINGQRVSRFAPILILTAPAFLFTIPYGHPFHYAFTLSLAAVYLLLNVNQDLKKSCWVIAFIIATVLQSVALSIRMEQAGLFLFCVAGYYLYQEKFEFRKYLVFFLHVCVALVVSFTLKTILLTGGIAAEGIEANKYLNLLRHSSIQLHKLSWSAAHHVVEIGIPIILLTLFCLYDLARRRDFRKILGFAISVFPPAFIYLFNPSPPRHLIITIISLSVFIAATYRLSHKINIIRFGVAVLSINLLLPPVIYLTPLGKDDGQRRNYTYNVIQRQERNQEQSRHALEFFKAMKQGAPDQTILVGNWIHVAQMSMILSDDPTLEISGANLAPGIKVVSYSFSGKTFYLVESYSLQEMDGLLKSVDRKKFTILTLVDKLNDINELGTDIPEQIYWWNA